MCCHVMIKKIKTDHDNAYQILNLLTQTHAHTQNSTHVVDEVTVHDKQCKYQACKNIARLEIQR